MKLFKSGKEYFSDDKNLIESIKNIFGFYPENFHLYKLAFRHKSVAHELKDGIKDSNERLEYLGDAILSAIIADFLFKKFPFKDEGFLTNMRSKIVSRNQLNNLSVKFGFDKLIQSSKDASAQSKFLNGNAFEAFIGAMYLDKGYEFAKKIIIEKIIKYHIDIEELEATVINYKSKMIEWAQKEKKSIEYKLIDEIGEGNLKQYVVELIIDGEVFSTGQDFSIKHAEQNASEKAYSKANIDNKNI